MKPILVLILTNHGTLQNGLLALLTTISQISTVLVAEGIDSGLRMLKDHRPDLLLLDMDLPKDGAQTILNQLKSQPSHLQTIALVNNAQKEEGAISLGADDVLLKGFSAATIISAIEEICGQQGRKDLHLD